MTTTTFGSGTFGAGSLVGVPVRRVEDPTLLRGEGTYIDNLDLPGALHLAFVRSPMAHAELTGVDASEARTMPGVVAVYSASDLDFPDHTGMMQLHPAVVRPAIARDRVRFVGDAVAVVVAETKAQAVDAAEAVIVDYEPLPAATDMESALAPDAPHPVQRRRIQRAPGCTRARRLRRAGRRRGRGARSVREPASGRRADGGRGGRGGPGRRRRRPRADRLPRVPDAALQPRRARQRVRDRAREGAADRTARRWFVRRQALDARGHRRGARRARARATGEVGRDPLREHGRHAARSRAGAVPRDGSTARRHHHRVALPSRRRRRRVRRLRRHARVRAHPHDVAGRLPHPEDRVRLRSRAHQPRADGCVPRRRPSGSGGDARAHPRHGGGRARHRPGRDPSPQLPAP